MKALTLTQPWATLVALGAKKIETRSWSTSYRGWLAIHAAKNCPKRDMDFWREEPFKAALYPGGIYTYPELECGMVLAKALLIGCKLIVENGSCIGHGEIHKMIPPEDPERSFGDYYAGRYGWILSNVRKFPTPIPAKGALGLWEWEPLELKG